MAFYPPGDPTPTEKRTDRMLLRPLRASDVELDYDAVITSAEELRRWSQTTWPADEFTLAENLEDLERHEREHVAGDAFTFTVMNPGATRCLGCVYVTPLSQHIVEKCALAAHTANVTFWVRTSELAGGLDQHLFATVREWFAADWPFEEVVHIVSRQVERQVALIEEAGFERSAVTLVDERQCWLFRRYRAR